MDKGYYKGLNVTANIGKIGSVLIPLALMYGIVKNCNDDVNKVLKTPKPPVEKSLDTK